jgi:acetate kinase
MPTIMTINGGSSSIRAALYESSPGLRQSFAASIERIGLPGTQLSMTGEEGAAARVEAISGTSDHRSAARYLFDRLDASGDCAGLVAAGHRVVNGGQRTAAERITPQLLAELRRMAPLDPEHLPREIELIEVLRERHPDLPQVACFDTAFHRGMPAVAKRLGLPRRYAARGVERLGFHGLSYEYLVGELRRVAEPAATRGRMVIAHLGNGASLCALRDGASIDTSMSFTPSSGILMSTRSGDLDPGLVDYLARTEQMTPAGFQTMTTHASGLLGISETSSDVRDLLSVEAADVRAAEALESFCYQAKKTIGAYAAVLGGLDALVFAGGIGERAAPIRARICAGLEFLGVEFDAGANAAAPGPAATAALISTGASRVRVRVVCTDEAVTIVKQTCGVLGLAAAELDRLS